MEGEHYLNFVVSMSYHGYRLEKQNVSIRVGGLNWMTDGNLEQFLNHFYNNGLLYFDYIIINSRSGDNRKFSAKNILEASTTVGDDGLTFIERIMNRPVRSKSFAEQLFLLIDFASDDDKRIFMFFLTMILARLGIFCGMVLFESGGNREYLFQIQGPADQYPDEGTYVTPNNAAFFLRHTIRGEEMVGGQEQHSGYFTNLLPPYDDNYALALLRGYLYYTFKTKPLNLLKKLIDKPEMKISAIAKVDERGRIKASEDSECLVYMSFPIQRSLPASGLYMANIEESRRAADVQYLDYVTTVNIEDVHRPDSTIEQVINYSFSKNEFTLEQTLNADDYLLDTTCYTYEQMAKYNLDRLKQRRNPQNNIGCSIM